MAFITDHSCAE